MESVKSLSPVLENLRLAFCFEINEGSVIMVPLLNV